MEKALAQMMGQSDWLQAQLTSEQPHGRGTEDRMGKGIEHAQGENLVDLFQQLYDLTIEQSKSIQAKTTRDCRTYWRKRNRRSWTVLMGWI